MHWKRPLDLNCHQCMGQHILSNQSIPSNRTTSRRFRLMQHCYQKCFTRIYTTCSPSIMPAIIDQFPIQVQETINCGIFVVVFCLAFFESNSQSISEFLTIDEYRFLMVVWLLTKSTPLPFLFNNSRICRHRLLTIQRFRPRRVCSQ